MNQTWIDSIKNLLTLRTMQIDLYNSSFKAISTISSITTGTAIYSAPAGKIFAITDLQVSCDNNNIVTLFDGQNGMDTIFKGFFQTQGTTSANLDHTYSTPFFGFSPGGTIEISTTQVNDVFISITGYLI